MSNSDILHDAEVVVTAPLVMSGNGYLRGLRVYACDTQGGSGKYVGEAKLIPEDAGPKIPKGKYRVIVLVLKDDKA